MRVRMEKVQTSCDGIGALLVGVIIAVVIALTTAVTLPMAVAGIASMFFAQMALEESKSIEVFNLRTGSMFLQIIALTATISWGIGNWWIMLHYGLPSFLGILYPDVARQFRGTPNAVDLPNGV